MAFFGFKARGGEKKTDFMIRYAYKCGVRSNESSKNWQFSARHYLVPLAA
jgi:hypothetical protein